mmetsp:Transcript_27346/g.40793  ORF Transcript_27346/g.40793 Transcript_27346/m.40793 type:complete len:87 (-) Transcript_27346:380-640(-)
MLLHFSSTRNKKVRPPSDGSVDGPGIDDENNGKISAAPTRKLRAAFFEKAVDNNASAEVVHGHIVELCVTFSTTANFFWLIISPRT